MKKFFVYFTCIATLATSGTAYCNPYDLIAKLQLQLDQQQDEIRQLRGETQALKALISKDSPALQAPQPQTVSEAQTPSDFSAGTVSPQVDATLMYTHAYDMLEARRFSDARAAFGDFVRTFPHNPLTMNAYYWLGEMDYMNGNYADAALKFGDAYEEFKSQKTSGYTGEALNRAPEVMMKMAMAMSNLGKHQAAKLTLVELEKEFPMMPENISQQVSLLKRELTRKAA